jgi:hypothetical protein
MTRNTIRDTVAAVTVSQPVKHKRKAPRKGARNGMVKTVGVNPAIMAAARKALRPGERIVIVSPGRVETRRA